MYPPTANPHGCSHRPCEAVGVNEGNVTRSAQRGTIVAQDVSPGSALRLSSMSPLGRHNRGRDRTPDFAYSRAVECSLDTLYQVKGLCRPRRDSGYSESNLFPALTCWATIVPPFGLAIP